MDHLLDLSPWERGKLWVLSAEAKDLKAKAGDGQAEEEVGVIMEAPDGKGEAAP